MVSFIDMFDNVKGFAKRNQTKANTKANEDTADLSRRDTGGSISSTASIISVEKVKSAGPQLYRKVSGAVTPQYPSNWADSPRNSRRRRSAPNAKRQGSGASAQDFKVVVSPPPPPYEPWQRLNMLEEE